jgi:hypothetical protein
LAHILIGEPAATSPGYALVLSEGSEFLAEPEIQSLRRYEPDQVRRISTPPVMPEGLAQWFLSPLPGISLE